MPASPRSRVATAVRALRHRNFQLFFAGQLISLVGTWMQTVAQSWLVYRLTGSTLLLGTVGFASQIPVFLVAPIGGIVADRVNRHRVVIATQISSMILASILAFLTLTNRIQVWEIIGAGGWAGSGECVRYSRAAGIPDRHGGPGRPDERHRAELVDVQRRAHSRSGDCGHSGGVGRRGMVLLRQCRELHRGDRRPAADADRASRRISATRARRSRTSWRDFASCGMRRRFGRFSCCSGW